MPTRPRPIALDKTVRMSEDSDAAPIVENPKLTPMTEAAPRPRRIGRRIVLMGAAAAPAAGGETMKPMPARLPPAVSKPEEDQVAPPPAPAAGPMSVRLRLRIDRGRVTVIGARAVPGAVAMPERLDYGLAYEITNGNRRVAVGSVPDVGTRRSFPDPERRPGLEGHHLEELESIEVNVRVPQREFSAAALPRLRVTLFRMKAQPAAAITAAPLAEQFRDQLRPVAELRGINVSQLPQVLQREMRAAMPTAPVRRARPQR
jgi:hypothetical protein